jgi:hypothetical protein
MATMATCGFCKGSGETVFPSTILPAVICAHRCLLCNGTGQATHWTDWALVDLSNRQPLFRFPPLEDEGKTQ